MGPGAGPAPVEAVSTGAGPSPPLSLGPPIETCAQQQGPQGWQRGPTRRLGPGPSPGSYSISPAGRSTRPPQVPPAVWHSQSTLEAEQELPRPGPSPLSPGAAVQSADRAAPTKPIPRPGTPELKGGGGGAAPISFRPTAAAVGGPQHRLPETTLEQVTGSLLLQNPTAAVGGLKQLSSG